MHVVILPAWYPSSEDRVNGSFIRDHAIGLAELHDVTVLAPSGGNAASDTVDEGVRVLRVPAPRAHGKLRTILDFRQTRDRMAALYGGARPPDLVHAHVYSAGAFAARLKKRWRFPLVLSEHDSDLIEGRVRGWSATVARYAFRSADVVCPDSELLMQRIVALEPRARCQVVHEAVDVDAFMPSSLDAPPRQPHRLLTVARLYEAKGIPHLLEAVRSLLAQYPDVSLEIVGTGPLRSQLAALAIDLPVTFLGPLSRDQVAQRMRANAVFVLPSIVEPFGIVAIEALAAGMNVVVTDACGSSTAVARHGGLVVRAGDSVALAEAIAAMLERGPAEPDRRLINDLRGAFSPIAIARQFDAIYQDLLAR
jgi:glycosyltransferase involved in cell wall biosynthesis